MKQIYAPQQLTAVMPSSYIPPKPIFVIKVPLSIPPVEIDKVRQAITKDNITNDYHVLVVGGNNDDYEFEMYNADKIERQNWNELVNKIMK